VAIAKRTVTSSENIVWAMAEVCSRQVAPDNCSCECGRGRRANVSKQAVTIKLKKGPAALSTAQHELI
jgi:hypothetical protein